ncbi:hypothetical protein [Subtercola frigoramans]|uniref:GNAT family N-acetyltransferase n=1 Tax=Subtercola frigoramans TaxID=120298 RepID=A0ABS2L396_9MICO|nr:hypothetical protein [Subtercola frigoramans]MBM7471489.1 hypothetical protein [Subtercola frigoramans]
MSAEAYGRGLATGEFRRDWTWLALLDDAIVASAVWWGPAFAVHPVELRCLLVHPDIPHPEVWGAALIRSGNRSFSAAGALFVPEVVNETLGGVVGEVVIDDTATSWRAAAYRDAGVIVADRSTGEDGRGSARSTDGSTVRQSVGQGAVGSAVAGPTGRVSLRR